MQNKLYRNVTKDLTFIDPWKWSLSAIHFNQIQDTTSSPTLSRLLASGANKTGSISTSRIPEETLGSNVDNLCQEMNDLMHDYEVVARISTLVSTLKGTYDVSSAFIFFDITYICMKHVNNGV